MLRANPGLAALARTLTRTLWAAGLSLGAPLAHSAEPVHLRLQWRWVQHSASAADLQAVRDGAPITSTSGAYAPKGPGKTTRTPRSPITAQGELKVQSGHTAQVHWPADAPSAPAWVVVQTGLAQAWLPLTPASSAASAPIPPGVTFSPRWRGPQQPVDIEVQACVPHRSFAEPSTPTACQHARTRLPLGRWHTVLQSRATAPAPAPTPGTLSSRDAAPSTTQALQVRVERVERVEPAEQVERD